MLIPQFSLRWMLAVTSVLAIVFLIFSQAVRGSSWAAGVSLALVVLAGTMLVHGLLFFLVWLFSLIGEQRQLRRQRTAQTTDKPAASPFASAVANAAQPVSAATGSEAE